MKKFLKRANRGLILAALLLAGFVIFVIADTSAFKKNKPQIETAVNGYLDTLSECAVTAESKEDFQKNYDSLIADYWSPDCPRGDNFWGITVSGVKNEFDSMSEEIYSGKYKGKITKWNARPYNFKIVKSGTGYATVSFSCEITAEFEGNPYIVTPCEIQKPGDMLYGESDIPENAPMKLSMTGEYEYQMVKDGDNWKVCETQSWGWCEPSVTAVLPEEGGNE